MMLFLNILININKEQRKEKERTWNSKARLRDAIQISNSSEDPVTSLSSWLSFRTLIWMCSLGKRMEIARSRWRCCENRYTLWSLVQLIWGYNCSNMLANCDFEIIRKPHSWRSSFDIDNQSIGFIKYKYVGLSIQ